MDDLYKEFDESDLEAREVLEDLKNSGLEDAYQVLRRHMWNGITVINNQTILLNKANAKLDLQKEYNDERFSKDIKHSIISDRHSSNGSRKGFLKRENAYSQLRIWRDEAPERTQNALAEMLEADARNDNEKYGGKISMRTCQTYAKAIKEGK